MMNRGDKTDAVRERLPRLWRLGLVALCTLILCSCRSRGPMDVMSGAPPALPNAAFTGEQTPPPCPNAPVAYVPEGTQFGTPLPYAPAGPWAPPGIRQPWPEDEYLVDGGDRNVQVAVAEDWQVRGLEPEDAVAHFDTLDGRTLVEPSNCVHLYAPRFGSVRKIVSLIQDEQTDRVSDVHRPVTLVRCDDVAEAATSKQEIQPGRNVGARPPVIYKGKQGDGALSVALGVLSFHNAFKPYENLQLIREGIVEGTESAYLAKGVAAAITWSHDKAVQVILDNQAAAEEVSDRAAWTIYTVDQPPPCPKLRLVKVASTQFAEPGDVIDFTLRFDNVGNQPIGNVTILDDLTTRLEYVPDSAQSSLEATFRTEPNGAGSQILRWEIKDPLPPGQGGIVRFRCRVR